MEKKQTPLERTGPPFLLRIEALFYITPAINGGAF